MEDNNSKQVCLFYARVSTEHSEQDTSLEAQVKLMQSYMKRHPEKQLEASFIERVSGKSDNRPEFQKMINRIKEGGVSFVLIKDFKRISRSTEVSDNLKKLSKHYGFKFILLSTGEVYDPNTNEHRLMFGFEALLNEDMVHRQSEYGRVAHRQKCEAKRLNRNNITFGYTWDEKNKNIVIDEEQAEVIREIFNLYVFKSYGVKEIKKYLYDKGYNVSQPTINKYLQDESYIGIFHLNKRGSELGVGAGEKTKRYFNPKEEWIPVERPELAIVDSEIFELATKIRESRTRYYMPDVNGKKQGRYSGKHVFSSKVFCAECGYPYTFVYLDRNKTIPTYRDSYNQKVVVKKCINTEFYRVHESDLKMITAKAINGLVGGSEKIVSMLEAAIKTTLTKSLNKESKVSELIKKKERMESKAEKTKNKYLEASGALGKVLEEEYNSLVEQIALVDDEIDRMKNADEGAKEIRRKLDDRIKNISTALKGYADVDVDDITREMVQAVVERIIISKEGKTKVILNGNHISEFQLTTQKGKHRNCASFSVEGIRTNPDEEYTKNQLMVMFEEYIKKSSGQAQVSLMEYEVKRSTAYKSIKVDRFITTVELYIEES